VYLLVWKMLRRDMTQNAKQSLVHYFIKII
jgi:hypothetical protein